jgi:serine phosphatase RsbU (regulator of sigma subunit)
VLELKDFFHLPEIEPLVEQLIADGPGLIVVAGLDPRPLPPPTTSDGFLPSGRAAILRILMRQMLTAHPGRRAIVVAEAEDAIRVHRDLRRRVQLSPVQPPETYADAIARATNRRPDLLVIEQLTAESAPAALQAARAGLRVLSQLDTVFRGAEVGRHLLDLGVRRDLLDGLAWVVAVQRLATLCPRCKEPAPPDPAQLAELRRRHPDLDIALEGKILYQASGCPHCRHTGRESEVAAFDIFCSDTDAASPLEQPSLLSLEAYMLGLAARGHLPLDDVLHLETDQLRRTYNLLAASERAVTEAKAALERRLAELEAANRVLQQRTEALISLEGIGQALITSTGLDELAARLCRNARDLCGADRAILYFLRPEEGIAEVLAVCGWDPELVHQPLEAGPILGTDAEPTPCNDWPPGVPRRPTDLTAATLRAGLRVPLVAQDKQVGLMIVHTSQKPRFGPGEVALLQTFANQAALAIQRAGLVEALQDKITQLQAAQAELVQKERMERELELARQVQQSVLPRIFPLMPGYLFAARSDPARWVGGDFYDVILLDADRFGVVIGDVSDKGMPAALYMAQTHSLLLAEAHRETSPRVVLANVHRLLQELGRSDMFVTVFYGVVDGPARRLTYARAGHDQPLLLREGQLQTLAGEGTFLGFPDLDELHLSEEQMDLLPGDRLVLYTDGLTDVWTPNGRPFGLARLHALLLSHAHLPPVELCAATFTDLAAHQGAAEQYDDMTMLVVEVRETGQVSHPSLKPADRPMEEHR